MAYKRMIHSNFFDTSDLIRYNEKEKLFLIGLVCFADDFGKIWLDPRRLRADIFTGESRTSTTWIKNTVKKFIENGILCTYCLEGVRYCHFPNWFVKGWFLKQRIDNPRENIHPDCPTCQTEEIARRKREISRTRKEKINKEKINKENPLAENHKQLKNKNRQTIGYYLNQFLIKDKNDEK